MVQLFCMDLAAGYRALVRKHFSQARIVADRFHDPYRQSPLPGVLEGDRPGGSQEPRPDFFDRRHRHNLTAQQHERFSAYLRERPALEAIYRFKQRLCYALLEMLAII